MCSIKFIVICRHNESYLTACNILGYLSLLGILKHRIRKLCYENNKDVRKAYNSINVHIIIIFEGVRWEYLDTMLVHGIYYSIRWSKHKGIPLSPKYLSYICNYTLSVVPGVRQSIEAGTYYIQFSFH